MHTVERESKHGKRGPFNNLLETQFVGGSLFRTLRSVNTAVLTTLLSIEREVSGI